ncbi:hypothetical protein [Thiocystis violacea]|uniref:hypothetical protein n=1 Tax=Thiocystis violacea TaxID=13725 RepID=UPI0019042AB6|nr:hypothetical protein [Thiocystis violacea]MBK1725307.1 hypothetical protein [Thiocystis violacea]
MQVQRLYDQVRNRRVSIELPENFNDRRVEIIVLTLDEPTETSSPQHRRPHPDIAGQVKIHGDILRSAPESDWDLP